MLLNFVTVKRNFLPIHPSQLPYNRSVFGHPVPLSKICVQTPFLTKFIGHPITLFPAGV
jgi:hypothetical protein